MKPVNLRNFDLNLLPILGALLEEKSVTAASRRVHLSQSATSSALRRLRECFNDPILLRRGQHMVASQKALLIHAELAEALDKLGSVLGTMRYGSGAEPYLDVNICAPEYVSMSMTQTIRNLLGSHEKHLNINILPLLRKTIFDRMEDGTVDIAIGAFGRLKPNFHRQPVYKESIIVVMRHDHPAIAASRDGTISLADFTSYPHVQVTAGEILEDAWISRKLNSHSVVRQVNAVLPTVSLLSDVLLNTDLLCVGTVRGLESMPEGEKSKLGFLKMPDSLDIELYDIEMIWHEQTHRDPDLAWVREQIVSGEAA